MGPGGAWWEPASWSGGVRYVGGASLICGFCMERGKVSTDTGVSASLWGGVPRGRAVSGRNREPLSTDAVLAGGPAHSSAEAPVMGVELVNTNVEGGVGIEMAGLAGSGAVRVMEVGWPSGAALRGVVANHRALRPLTVVRGERHGKGAPVS